MDRLPHPIRGEASMMFLPFLVLAAGLLAVFYGRRRWALGFWATGLLLLVVLFRLHATDVLNLGF
jgi:hypothetical protein